MHNVFDNQTSEAVELGEEFIDLELIVEEDEEVESL